MNRRSFFRNLAIGVATAPVLAKVVSEPVPEVMEFADMDCTDMPFPSDAMQQIARHIAENNPYAGLVLAADQNPLRFTA